MSAETRIWVAEASGARADAYLASISDYTRSQIQKWIKNGALLVNGIAVKPNAIIKKDDLIKLTVPETEQLEVVPQDIPIDIVYEDEALCVINKPKGLVVHPAAGNPDGTLVNALLYHFSSLSTIGGAIRPGVVHRIDKDTSGLLVVAKNDFAHEKLAKQFADHSARRTYLCIVHGNLKEDFGTVDAPIGRHPTDRKKMAVVKDGREAVTHWQVIARYGDMTFLRVKLETGRTHQIRVHMAYIKHPIAGDPLYGSKAPRLGLESQALHGYRLDLIHPISDKHMTFYAPLPEDMTTALKRLSPDGILPTWEED